MVGSPIASCASSKRTGRARLNAAGRRALQPGSERWPECSAGSNLNNSLTIKFLACPSGQAEGDPGRRGHAMQDLQAPLADADAQSVTLVNSVSRRLG